MFDVKDFNALVNIVAIASFDKQETVDQDARRYNWTPDISIMNLQMFR